MNLRVIVPLVILTFTSSLAAAADVSGKWKSEFDSQVGHQKYTYEFKQDGEKLGGKAHREVDGQKTETEIKEGKVVGDAIEFVETLKFNDQEIRIEYKGKVAGGEIKFTRKVGDFATLEIVAKKDGAAPSASASKGPTLKVVRVDSEETSGENGRGSNAVDGDQWTIWHTQWEDESPAHPHEIVIELTPPARVKGFTYLPRQDEQVNGTIKRYEFYVSDSDKEFGEAVKRGEFADGREKQTITFEAKSGKYVRLRARSEINGEPWASAAEIGVITE